MSNWRGIGDFYPRDRRGMELMDWETGQALDAHCERLVAARGHHAQRAVSQSYLYADTSASLSPTALDIIVDLNPPIAPEDENWARLLSTLEIFVNSSMMGAAQLRVIMRTPVSAEAALHSHIIVYYGDPNDASAMTIFSAYRDVHGWIMDPRSRNMRGAAVGPNGILQPPVLGEEDLAALDTLTATATNPYIILGADILRDLAHTINTTI